MVGGPAIHLCFNTHPNHPPFLASTTTTKLAFPVSKSPSRFPHSNTLSISQFIVLNSSPLSKTSLKPLSYHQSANSIKGAYDPELRSVLELATDSELYDLKRILFGPSYFSPLLKSITMSGVNVDDPYIGEDMEEREDSISVLESRFLFLAADARSTLRGWRPSYRNVLLGVRNKLNIPCSRKLSTEDLEVEIYLHLLQEYSSSEIGVTQWKVQAVTALRAWVPELRSTILKGGSMFTLGKLYKSLATRLSGKMFLEATKCQVKNEVLKKGGQLAAINLESRVALHVAKQGFAKAVSRYLGLRSMMVLLGPMLWGTFLADVVIQMLGTDYARILQAICAVAQVLACVVEGTKGSLGLSANCKA